MKRNILIGAAFLLGTAAHATYFEAPALAGAEPVNPDSTGFKFTDVKVIKTTPVKDQNKSGTCWAFSGISTLEDDLLRRGKGEHDLSEMFVVRNAYIDKAKKYIRTNGKINFAQGGSFEDVLEMTRRYGAMPEEAYAGLNYGEKKHSHYEMAGALASYLDAVLENGKRTNKLTTAWLPGFIGILDAYLGPVPESFTYNGKTYTPQSFAKEIGLEPDNFEIFTSYTHHPFYEKFALEIPDNWLWSENMNVPLDELLKITDNALDKGYTVFWGADVSEGGFKWANGYAVNPEEKTEKDMTDAEVARWAKLSDKDRDKEQFEIKGPVKEKTVTQESRQLGFDNYQTTDDHGMVIVGYATDQEGNKYYKVKNSWDTNQIYDGYFYVSVPYFLEKTMNIGVRKEAIPSDIAKKLK
ncbi:MAG: aminopeptidase [Bacteroides sp.]|nr:aminopeptidase [Bacteroides sp.]